MTRKHFEAIAAIIATRVPFADPKHEEWAAAAVAELAENLAGYFATENPNFDRHRFLKACGL